MLRFEFDFKKYNISFPMEVRGKRRDGFNLFTFKEHNEKFFLLGRNPDLKLRHVVNVVLHCIAVLTKALVENYAKDVKDTPQDNHHDPFSYSLL